MNSVIARQEDGTIQLIITIPASEVTHGKGEVTDKFAQELEVSGFRKGNAPRDIVESRIDKRKLQEEVLKQLLPKAYLKAVEDHKLRPIMSPKIHVQKLEEGNDWVFTAFTCEMPDVNLGPYKAEIKKVTAKSKIIIPGQESFDIGHSAELSRSPQGKQEQPKFEDIIKTLLESVDVKIPLVLLEHEADRLLAQTLDEIKRLGLTLDQYLASTKRTPDDLRTEYMTKAGNDLKLEFVLQKIAQDEQITVEETEIDEAVQKAKDPKERENLEKNRYLLASILRQQKTLDFLRQL